MMSSSCYLRSWPTLCLCLPLSLLLLLLPSPSLSLSSDAVLLLSLKYSVLLDPSSLLLNWNYDDLTPCGWTGVNCTHIPSPALPNVTSVWRVTSLSLPGAGLVGSIPSDVGMMEYLSVYRRPYPRRHQQGPHQLRPHRSPRRLQFNPQ